jgi:hypothetical protein
MNAIEACQKARAEFVVEREIIDKKIEALDLAIMALGGVEKPARKPAKAKPAAKPNGTNGHASADDMNGAADLVLSALRDCPAGMTSRVLRDELGWPPIKFKAVLAALVTGNKIVKFGERAGTGYKLA